MRPIILEEYIGKRLFDQEKRMDFIKNLAFISLGQVLITLQHNWPYLVMSVVIAALLKIYVNAEKVTAS